MKTLLWMVALLMTAGCVSPQAAEWFHGDERCPPPRDDGSYSAPYNPLDHPRDYPTFAGADKPGWSCSYPRSDGVHVQFGDSRTPQQQWLAVWGNNNSEN